MSKRKRSYHMFPIRLRIERERQKISQADLAKLTGFQPSAISHFECGRREPTLTNAVRIARGLGIELVALI